MKKDKVAVIGLVSISDRASGGVYEDQGIPALKEWLAKVVLSPIKLVEKLIPDEQDKIEDTLKKLCDKDKCDLILTTGGTGPSKRDVTPEATLAVATREMPGFGEQMRAISQVFVPTAILSRQVGVLREIKGHSALIINLPGQPKAIAETLEGLPKKNVNGIFAAIPYCIELMGGPSIETDPAYVKAFRPKSAKRPHIIDSIIQEPEGKADCSVIVLHGLGADGADFEDLRDELIDCGAPLQNARVILPSAPYRPITMNAGYEMRAWYDFYGPNQADKRDDKSMNETFALIKRLIAEEETRGIPREKIFLGGFSQGGCMTLYSAVRLAAPIGGFFCLSGYTADTADQLKSPSAAISTPIFMGHGEDDSVVPYEFAKLSAAEMKKMGAKNIVSYGYPGMDHALCQEEIIDLAKFFVGILGWPKD